MSLKKKPQGAKSKKRSYRFNPYYDMIKMFSGLGVYLWYRPKVYYLSENAQKRINGGVIIASNHISTHDPVILFSVFWYRRLSFLATKELFEKRINRFFFKNMNCVLVDRENFNISSVRAVCDRLRAGKAVVIFPEGAINRGEDIMGFKDGTAFMAQRSGRPVLPVYIAKRESFFHPTSIIIGEPVDVGELCAGYPKKEGLARASEYLRDRELQLEQFYFSRVMGKSVRKAQKRADKKIKTVVIMSRVPENIEFEPIYPPERYEMISNCGNERVRREKYFAWTLLERAVKMKYGRSLDCFDINKNENGKWVSDKFYFSISHSNGVAAVAVSQKSVGSVGVDVESVRRHHEGIEKMILTPREREAMEALPPEARTEYVIKIWTQKESIFKSLDKRSFFPLSIETSDYRVITHERDVDEEKFILSVCSERSLDGLKIIFEL